MCLLGVMGEKAGRRLQIREMDKRFPEDKVCKAEPKNTKELSGGS